MESDSEVSIEEERIIHCSCGGKFKNNKASHIQHIKTKRHQKYVFEETKNDFEDATYMTIHEVKEENDSSRQRTESFHDK